MVINARSQKWLTTLVWIAAIILLWEAGAWLLQDVIHDTMAKQKLPFLHTVVATFIANLWSLLDSGLVTVSKAFFGFLIGGCFGFLVAVFMSYNRILEKVTFPYVIISQMIPILGLAPIIWSIVRSPDAARVIIAAFITFFPVTVNTLSGLKSVDKDQIDLMYSYAATKPEVFTKLMLPSTLPNLFVGLKIAAPRSITAAILVEMLGTDKGIGVKILYTLYYGANGTHLFWASVIMAALLGMSFFGFVLLLEKLLVPWESALSKKEGGN